MLRAFERLRANATRPCNLTTKRCIENDQLTSRKKRQFRSRVFRFVVNRFVFQAICFGDRSFLITDEIAGVASAPIERTGNTPSTATPGNHSHSDQGVRPPSSFHV